MNKKKLLLSFIAFFMAIAAHCARFTVDDFTYTTLDDEAHTVQLTGVKSQDAELKIPETVEYEGVTYTVTSVNLSLSAFSSGTRNISIVTVPKTVEEIERLKGTRLTSIQFAEGSQLKTIRHGAFSPNRFEKISLPESVETIEAYAFQNVPERLVENYKKGGVWSIFEVLGGIVGLSDEEISDILAGVNEIEIDGNGLTGAADVFYTISGQRVTKPGKGLYIHNGKKVVIK